MICPGLVYVTYSLPLFYCCYFAADNSMDVPQVGEEEEEEEVEVDVETAEVEGG